MKLSLPIPSVMARHVALLAVVLPVSALLGADAAETPAKTAPAGAGSGTCRLRIDGRAIEQLTLVDERDNPTAFAQPGGSVSLPAGKYRVQQVKLRGGFHGYHFGGGDQDWLEVTANQTPVLKAGAPLTPQVRVQRVGRLLTLNYELVDAAACRYTPDDGEAPPPQFSILKDGRTIGSDSFAYG